jgi:hypothetical protein
MLHANRQARTQPQHFKQASLCIHQEHGAPTAGATEFALKDEGDCSPAINTMIVIKMTPPFPKRW